MKIDELVTYPHFSHVVYIGDYNADNIVEIPDVKTVIASFYKDMNFRSYLEETFPKADKVYLSNDSEYSYSYIIEKITNTKRKVLVLVDEKANFEFCTKIFKQKNVEIGLSEKAFKVAHNVLDTLMVKYELHANKKCWIVVNV